MWGGRGASREAFKIPLWRDKHRSHLRTGISARAWHLSPIPVTAHDSLVSHLCHSWEPEASLWDPGGGCVCAHLPWALATG